MAASARTAPKSMSLINRTVPSPIFDSWRPESVSKGRNAHLNELRTETVFLLIFCVEGLVSSFRTAVKMPSIMSRRQMNYTHIRIAIPKY